MTGKGVEAEPSDAIMTNSVYEQGKSQFVTIRVIGKESTKGKVVLRAEFDDMHSELLVFVQTEESVEPENGFAFIPVNVTFVAGQRRKLRLVADTRVVKRGTLVHVASTEVAIEVLKERMTVSAPNLGRNLSEEVIEITCKKVDVRGTITASAKTAEGEMVASCRIHVVEKEVPKTFLKDFKLDNKKDGHQRASYKGGTVYVHVKAPVLGAYFGRNEERLNKGKEADAIAILADTVLQCVCKEWARYLIEQSVELPLSDNMEIEVERIRNRLEYQYGSQIHNKIVALQRAVPVPTDVE